MTRLVSQQALSDALGVPVVPAHGVAMDQDERRSAAPVGVVQADVVHLDEPASGRMPALCAARGEVIGQRKPSERQCTRGPSGL